MAGLLVVRAGYPWVYWPTYSRSQVFTDGKQVRPQRRDEGG